MSFDNMAHEAHFAAVREALEFSYAAGQIRTQADPPAIIVTLLPGVDLDQRLCDDEGIQKAEVIVYVVGRHDDDANLRVTIPLIKNVAVTKLDDHTLRYMLAWPNNGTSYVSFGLADRNGVYDLLLHYDLLASVCDRNVLFDVIWIATHRIGETVGGLAAATGGEYYFAGTT